MNGPTLLRCICDDTRFEMLELLGKNREMCVGDFVHAMEKNQPLVSHHLKILRQCGIVKASADGKRMVYRISDDQMAEVVAGITRAGKRIKALSEKNCC